MIPTRGNREEAEDGKMDGFLLANSHPLIHYPFYLSVTFLFFMLNIIEEQEEELHGDRDKDEIEGWWKDSEEWTDSEWSFSVSRSSFWWPFFLVHFSIPSNPHLSTHCLFHYNSSLQCVIRVRWVRAMNGEGSHFARPPALSIPNLYHLSTGIIWL